MRISEIYNNKKIILWGYGREGKSMEEFLKRHCPDTKVVIYEGKADEPPVEECDYIIKSPGIPYFEKNDKMTSMTEIFMEEFKDQTIGITGTKGKSTTSALLYHVLKAAGKDVVLLGNIGLPCLDYYDGINKDTIIVFEMSCHQLSDIKVSPHIGVLLNLYEEHLDYYQTVDRYFRAKKNITAFQKEEDYLFTGGNVSDISSKAKIIRVDDRNVIPFELSILGDHNQYNANMVFEILTKIYGIDETVIREALVSFMGLPHRLECVGDHDGIIYYDDSISTIPEATIQAAESIPNIQTIIIGGMDRNIDYDILIDYIKLHAELKFILAYASGRRIYGSVSECKNVTLVKDLYEAVEMASRITDKGAACVMSPAAASYGYFKNFEERGDYFKELLEKL